MDKEILNHSSGQLMMMPSKREETLVEEAVVVGCRGRTSLVGLWCCLEVDWENCVARSRNRLDIGYFRPFWIRISGRVV